MRSLPFADSTFDVVVSSLGIGSASDLGASKNTVDFPSIAHRDRYEGIIKNEPARYLAGSLIEAAPIR